MLKNDVHELSIAVERALQEVEDAIASSAATSESLNSFWGLQDCLYRLLDRASDESDEAAVSFRTLHPRLLERVELLLKTAEDRKLTRNAGIASACINVQHHLQHLAEIAEHRVSAAHA